MATDLRFVTYAADRDPLELAPQSTGDRLAEAGLADSRGPHETQDRPGGVRVQLADREVLEDSILDLLHVVVILIEDGPCVVDIEVVNRLFIPGEINQPLEISANHTVLSRRWRQLLQPGQLPLGHLKSLLREPGCLYPLAQFIGFSNLFVLLAELGLDRFELLTQEVLALALVDRRLDL